MLRALAIIIAIAGTLLPEQASSQSIKLKLSYFSADRTTLHPSGSIRIIRKSAKRRELNCLLGGATRPRYCDM
jgi:hypothetical protein